MLSTQNSPRRVLIASANAFIRARLQKEYVKRWGANVRLVGTPSTLEETLVAMDALQPDLVIVDHDDVNINQAEFLNRFISGQSTVKVVLVSLNEAGQVVIYDRRQLDHAQADDWLSDPWQERTDQGNNKSLAERRSNMRHYAIVGFLIVVVTLVTDFAVYILRPFLLPVEASAQSVTIDSLFRLEILIISFLFALIMVPLVYSLIVFHRKPGETGDGEHIEGNYQLEVAWTIIPLFVVVGLAYIGAGNLASIRRIDPQAYAVHVTGFQWAWKFDYTEYGITSKELHLMVDKQVVLQMESPDVIHSFWVPEFRIKQDVVPGRVTEYRVTPIKTGSYKVRCAELCGASHAYMEATVIVQTEAEYRAWVEQQQAEAAAALTNLTPAERGQRLVSNNGCAACHSIDGSKGIGPTWKGLAGSAVPLADGSSVVVDDAYLKESIKTPNAKIVEGFQPNAMPQFTFTDAQIADLVEYIKTIK